MVLATKSSDLLRLKGWLLKMDTTMWSQVLLLAIVFVKISSSSRSCEGSEISLVLDPNNTLLVSYPGNGRPEVDAFNSVDFFWLDGVNRSSPEESIEINHLAIESLNGTWIFNITLMLSRELIRQLCIILEFKWIQNIYYINMSQVIEAPATSSNKSSTSDEINSETTELTTQETDPTGEKLTIGSIVMIVMVIIVVAVVVVVVMPVAAIVITVYCCFKKESTNVGVKHSPPETIQMVSFQESDGTSLTHRHYQMNTTRGPEVGDSNPVDENNMISSFRNEITATPSQDNGESVVSHTESHTAQPVDNDTLVAVVVDKGHVYERPNQTPTNGCCRFVFPDPPRT